MLDTRHVTTVIFDSGGVLLVPDPAAFRALLGPFGVTPDDEQCRQAHYGCTVDLDQLGEANWRLIDRGIAARLGVPEDHLDEAAVRVGEVYLERPWVPVAGAAEALRDLAAGGYALAVVSNAEGTMEEQLAEHRICSTSGADAAEVAIVVDSAVVGVAKPDPAIFEIALEALGVSPEECIYVGDTVHFDVAGSRAAGLRPVHIDPYGWCPGGDHPHVRSLEELVAGLVRGVDASQV